MRKGIMLHTNSPYPRKMGEYVVKNEDIALTDPEKIKQYLIDHGPVGCRDRDTEEWLKSNNIPAYFSGCLTLTLQRNPLIKRKDYIIAVDIPHEVEQEIKKRTTRPVYNISREISPYFTQEERFQIAKIVLYLYQSAHCVITSRLHAAMPCLALETPVLLLDSNDETIHNDGRYKGLAELCNTVKENDFMADKNSYDIATPPPQSLSISGFAA